MRHATIVGIFTVMLTLVSGLVFAEHVIDDSKNTGYLFVISGTSGSLDGDTLTLNGVPNVIYFSDRPARVAGHMTLQEFVGMWNKGNDSFKADPPNATLSILKKHSSNNVVFDLTRVWLRERNTIRFKVDVLTGAATGKFSTAVLYIDVNRDVEWEVIYGSAPGPGSHTPEYWTFKGRQ